ncbi:LLM class flavin-dependent oxidoreductase [Pseudomonas aeruginosa]|nr:LLM class flavin-dependent oxidoreductase [Pseudomonas aeruginosa]
MITATPSSEVDQPLGEAVDAGFVRRFAQAHEDAGFDRVLVGYFSNAAEGAVVSSFVAAATRRLGVLLAYRPGVIAAPLAARQLATLDQFSEGRLALNVVSGGNDEDLARDGDYLDHDRRYARTDEYLQALRAIWTATGPVDFDGEFYRFQGASPAVRPRQSPHIPIYFSGSSDAAIEVAARHADTYMLWGEPLAQAAETISAVREQARSNGREVEFSLSFRPILGRTEDEAWAKAEAIRASAGARLGEAGFPKGKPQSVGAQRLLKAVEQGERLDERLWTGIARLVGGGHNSTALVGTAEQVADALLAYYDLGVRNILIRGFDPLADAVEYGRELIPLTRAKVAERERRRATA